MKNRALILMCALMLTAIPVYAEEAAEENVISVSTMDELEEFIDQDVDEVISGLLEEYETIKATLEDFDAYQANPTMTEDFYNKTVTEIDGLSLRLREYAMKYAEIIMTSEDDYSDKYDDLEDIYDEVYEDAAEEIYDKIYDDLLDDMYDDIYEGIIDDAYDNVSYSVWDEARSAEYSMWDEARSEIYSMYDATRSDIYHFYDRMRSHTYKKDDAKIDKDMAKFQKKINKLKGLEVEEAITIDISTIDISAVTSTDEMALIVEADVETTVATLYSEFEALQAELDSYEHYKENASKAEDFYDHVVEEMELESGRLRTYALRYAEIITGSDMSFPDQYDALYDINDAIYSDAGSTLNQEIYGGLLKKAQKVFYNGIIKTGFDSDSYSNVSGLRSDEYRNVSGARSDVYSEISDMRSDIYSFVSDMRSAAWSKDGEKLDKVLAKFRKDTEKYNR